MTDRDPGHERRCRRAGCMNAVAQLRGDQAMQEVAVELALAECGRYGDLAPSAVFRAARPIIDAHTAPDGTIDRHRLIAALEAELVAIAAADADTAR